MRSAAAGSGEPSSMVALTAPPDDLLHKRVLNRATYEQIRGQIIVQ
jgi:hypothetical protein